MRRGWISHIIYTCHLPTTVEIIKIMLMKSNWWVDAGNHPSFVKPWVRLTWGIASEHKPLGEGFAACTASFDCPAKERHIFGAGSQHHFSCNAVQRACFWCTWMSTGLCVQTQTSGDVPWEYLQSFLVSRSWQPTLTFHPCPSRSLKKLADDRSHVCFQMWGQSWRST